MGIVVVPDPNSVNKNGLPTSSTGPDHISTSGISILADPAFTEQLKPFIGQQLTVAGLYSLTQKVGRWYRDHDRPFTGLAAPPQNVSSGVVQVVALQYRLGAILTEGNRWFSDDLLKDESGLEIGQTLTLSGVQQSLDRLNENPFRTVTAVFQPGEDPGETDVVLKTADRLPLRVYSSFDNSGVATLGRGEWSVGANWGNALWLDQQLSYQFTRSTSGRFNAHSLSWSIPLPWRDTIQIFGSYEQERPSLAADFNETGSGGQASLRYVHALPNLTLAKEIKLKEDVQIGYDFKTTNNNLEFGGFQVFGSEIEVDQFPFVYDATETDPYGQTTVTNQFVYSPGGVTQANNDRTFQVGVAGSSANYVYDRLQLTRVTLLPADFSWISRLVGQAANGNLQFSEQLDAGGPGSIRGYYSNTATGTRGLLLSQEIRTPARSVLGLLWPQSAVKDALQFGAFWDWGHVAQIKAVPDQAIAETLSSAGLDAQMTLDRYFSLQFDIGWQLRAKPGATERGAVGDLSLTFGY
jgi:hemolysin activation/secretion protein